MTGSKLVVLSTPGGQKPWICTGMYLFEYRKYEVSREDMDVRSDPREDTMSGAMVFNTGGLVNLTASCKRKYGYSTAWDNNILRGASGTQFCKLSG